MGWSLELCRCGDPQISGRCNLQREGLAQVGPFAEVVSIEVEALDASVFPIGDIDDILRIDSDAVRQVKLARSGSGRAPLAHALALGSVLENARIGIAVGNEDAAGG